MSIDKIIVALLGVAGIVWVYRFFLTRKDEEATVASEGNIDILVEGGYSPSVISIPKGQPTKINFLRKDPSNCLEEVILSDFKIRKYLPLNKKITIEITPQKKGKFPFSCGMNMFHGKIVVT